MSTQFKSLEELNKEFMLKQQQIKEEVEKQNTKKNDNDKKINLDNIVKKFCDNIKNIIKRDDKQHNIDKKDSHKNNSMEASRQTNEQKQDINMLTEYKAQTTDVIKSSLKTRKTINIITNVIFYSIIIFVLAGCISFASSNRQDKSLFGFRVYDISTPSMKPSYNPGDLIFVKLTNAKDIKLDDVITFTPSKEGKSYITHRVIEKIDDYQSTGKPAFKTKGDANGSADSFVVNSQQIIGVVKWSVPFLGKVVKFVKQNLVLLIIIVILTGVLCIFLRALFLANRNGKEDEEESLLKRE